MKGLIPFEFDSIGGLREEYIALIHLKCCLITALCINFYLSNFINNTKKQDIQNVY